MDKFDIVFFAVIAAFIVAIEVFMIVDVVGSPDTNPVNDYSEMD